MFENSLSAKNLPTFNKNEFIEIQPLLRSLDKTIEDESHLLGIAFKRNETKFISDDGNKLSQFLDV